MPRRLPRPVLVALVACMAMPVSANPGAQVEGFAFFCIETGGEIADVSARATKAGGVRVDMKGSGVGSGGDVVGFALRNAPGGPFLLTAETVARAASTDRQCVLMKPEADARAVERALRETPGFGAPSGRAESGGNRFTLWDISRLSPGGEVALIERIDGANTAVTLSYQRITEGGR